MGFISRRKIQVVLGCLWLLDGLLQLQPHMFTKTFITQVVQPAQAGQPFYIYDPIHLAIRIFLTHPALFNSFIAITQLSIGLLILYKATAKHGLWLSVAWGSFVWFFGEAAAGIFSGQASLLMGLPGAALLYAVIALGVMPKGTNKNQEEAKHPAYWLVIVWAILWISGAIYQLLPGQNSVSNLATMINGNGSGAPGWLATLDAHVASVINGFGSRTTSMAGLHMSTSQMAQMSTQPGSGYWFILLLAAIQIAIGLGVLASRNIRRAAIGAGIFLALIFWVIGQSLGGYYTGVMTDVQTSPLLILLGLSILSRSDYKRQLQAIYARLEKLMVGTKRRVAVDSTS